MKNKKIYIAIITCFAMALSLSACEVSNNSNQPDKMNDNSSLADGGTVTTEQLYGKITKITGNEIELSLADMPEPEVASEGDGSNMMDEGKAVAMTPALPAGSVIGDVGENMDFTGETLTITLPTGVKLYSMGQETTLSALKKGSLVAITVDNSEDMSVQSVDIWS